MPTRPSYVTPSLPCAYPMRTDTPAHASHACRCTWLASCMLPIMAVRLSPMWPMCPFPMLTYASISHALAQATCQPPGPMPCPMLLPCGLTKGLRWCSEYYGNPLTLRITPNIKHYKLPPSKKEYTWVVYLRKLYWGKIRFCVLDLCQQWQES